MLCIQQDTREADAKKRHILDHFANVGVKVVRSKMFVGDWTLLHKQDVCVDTKTGGCAEVYSNLVSQRDRFKAECVRARDAGIRLVILVEESGINSVEDVARWKNPRIEKYFKTKVAQSKGRMKNVRLAARPPVSSAQLAKTMETFAERYGVDWRFCEKADTGKVILEILGNAVDT